MTVTDRRNRLRDLFNASEILVSPGVYDGYSVRLVEAAGFETGAISGAGVSESHLGWADKGIMSFKDNLEACRAIQACTDLPLMADADTGYGNAVTTHFTVRAFEDAGLAGVMIEDQVWPKRCGHIAGKAVIEAEEMVQKVKAAVDARRDESFIIRSRTDAAGPLGVQAAIDRLNMYAEAGADVLYADALLSADDIRAVAAGVPKPLTVNMGLGLRHRSTTPLVHPKELQAMGVAAVTYPRLLSTSALRGMQNTMGAFKEMLEGDAPVERHDLQADFGELNSLMGLAELDAMDSKYGVTES